MKILDDYKLNIDDTDFLLKTKDYWKSKAKYSSKALLELDKIIICESESEINNFDFRQYCKTDTLVIDLYIHKKRVVSFYNGIFTTKSPLLTLFLDDKIKRQKRLKILPYVKDFQSILIKNNRAIPIGLTNKLIFERTEQYFYLKINLNNFIVNQVLDKLDKKKGELFLGVTIDNARNDGENEVLVCVMGINKGIQI